MQEENRSGPPPGAERTEIPRPQLLNPKAPCTSFNVPKAEAATGKPTHEGVPRDGRPTRRKRIASPRRSRTRECQAPGRTGTEIMDTLGWTSPARTGTGPRPTSSRAQTFFTPARKPPPGPSAKEDRGPNRPPACHSHRLRARTSSAPRPRLARFCPLGGEVPARDAGKARDEGKEYLAQDGDVTLFKFNA